MKSITINPERSLNLACLANSWAASKFVWNAVFSIDLSLVALPEFTSTATRASVWFMTKYPPDFKFTVGLNISDNCVSIPNFWKSKISYWMKFFKDFIIPLIF